MSKCIVCQEREEVGSIPSSLSQTGFSNLCNQCEIMTTLWRILAKLKDDENGN